VGAFLRSPRHACTLPSFFPLARVPGDPFQYLLIHPFERPAVTRRRLPPWRPFSLTQVLLYVIRKSISLPRPPFFPSQSPNCRDVSFQSVSPVFPPGQFLFPALLIERDSVGLSICYLVNFLVSLFSFELPLINLMDKFNGVSLVWLPFFCDFGLAHYGELPEARGS